jgi:ribose 5-phosphate isomerase B
VAAQVVSAERIPIGADHAGFELKEKLKAVLVGLGYEVADVGTHSPEPCDYADFAHPVAAEVESGRARRGVLLCGTGLGMSYAANRHAHVRAAVPWSVEIAGLARRHNDANILCVPARCVSDDVAVQILTTWLDTPFEGGRHERRIEKIEREEKP